MVKCLTPFFLAALSFSVSSIYGQPIKIGEFSRDTAGPAVWTTDASDPANILLVDETNAGIVQTAGNACHQFNRIFVADGNLVHQYDRNNLQAGQMREFQSSAEVLDVEPGSLLGQILVLDREKISIVDFKNSTSPQILGTYPHASDQANWGNLIERIGDYVYVADCSLPGFKILNILNPMNITEVGSYRTSIKGGGKQVSACPTDLHLEDEFVFLVAKSTVEVIHVGDLLYPNPVPVKTVKVQGLVELEINNSMGYLADGSRVRVFDFLGGSPSFGEELVNFETGQPITGLKYRGEKLFVLCGELGYQIWDLTGVS